MAVRDAGASRRPLSDAQVQGIEDLTQQVVQLAEQAGQRAAVEQTGDGAQQVAQQVAGSGCGDDVEHDLVEVDLQAEKVEVERSEDEMQDVARGHARCRPARSAPTGTSR